MMALAAQQLNSGANNQLSSLIAQPGQALNNYYKSFFDPSNAQNV